MSDADASGTAVPLDVKIGDDIVSLLTENDDWWFDFAYANRDGVLYAESYDEAGEVDRTFTVTITVEEVVR